MSCDLGDLLRKLVQAQHALIVQLVRLVTCDALPTPALLPSTGGGTAATGSQWWHGS